MKIIDSNGRLFGKINILDIIIVLAVLVLLFSVKVKYDKSPAQMTSDKKIVYTVEIENVRQMTVDAILSQTENVMDKETKKGLGNITGKNISKAKDIVKLVDGTYKTVSKEDKFDILLTLEVKGTETNDNYFTFTGKKLIVGDEIAIYNEKASASGMIKSIEVVSE